MAKLNLKATGRGDTEYSMFTSKYRQSQNIEDRRGPEFNEDRDRAAMDLWLAGQPKGKAGQARKVDPEEAIDTTSNRR